MKNLKKRVEAILFSVGRYISLEEIAILCKENQQKIKAALLELTVDYENDDSTSLVILNENEMWKLTTREEYGCLVRNVISQTELTKSQMETLAVIAFKYPIKQADLIKIRTNKAYEHLAELEIAGFITRQKYGRTRLIKLTDKFFDYFDLPQEKLKERFKGFNDLANTIEKKETEIEGIREEQKKEAEETREIEDKEKKLANGEIEIDLVDEKGSKHKLEVVDEQKEQPKTEEDKERLSGLEVFETENSEEKESEDIGLEKETKEKGQTKKENNLDFLKKGNNHSEKEKEVEKVSENDEENILKQDEKYKTEEIYKIESTSKQKVDSENSNEEGKDILEANESEEEK